MPVKSDFASTPQTRPSLISAHTKTPSRDSEGLSCLPDVILAVESYLATAAGELSYVPQSQQFTIEALRCTTLALNDFAADESIEFDRLLKSAMAIAITESPIRWQPVSEQKSQAMQPAAVPRLIKGLRWLPCLKLPLLRNLFMAFTKPFRKQAQ